MHHHGSPSFFDLWNPTLFLILGIIGCLYFQFVNREYQDTSGITHVTSKQKFSMIVGLVLFYIAQGSPLNYYGHHYFFSLHMLQQTILFLVVPIFVWMAIPEAMLRRFVYFRWVRPWFSFFTRPLIALFLFNILISVYHFPLIMDGLMRSEWLHLSYHSLLLITAFFMWFPIYGNLPELNRLSELHKLGYIFANGLLLTPACALIIFANHLLYDTYANVHFPFNWLTPLDDQQLGGIIMKIVQEIVYGVSLSIIFFSWYRKERNKDEIESHSS